MDSGGIDASNSLWADKWKIASWAWIEFGKEQTVQNKLNQYMMDSTVLDVLEWGSVGIEVTVEA